MATQALDAVDRRASKGMISVIFPALNEEEGIGQTMDDVPRAALEALGYDVEIIVVDGESVDRTREIAAEKGARVIIEPRKGYGRAYKTGFERAKGDIIATADADTTYPVERLADYVELLEKENLDFITTNRFGHMQRGAMKGMHHVGNFALTFATRSLFLVSIKDSQSGMWIFRKACLSKLNLTSDGMPLSEEIKIEAFRNKDVRAREIPIEYRERVGEVKLASWRDGWRNLTFLAKKRFGIAEPES